ncbi:unnamed protein product [Amoebophrya sp. A120]|nr:unnamed protein product [Amoebophrya sp. A120]|eukprot:GSA120T00022148001.1
MDNRIERGHLQHTLYILGKKNIYNFVFPYDVGAKKAGCNRCCYTCCYHAKTGYEPLRVMRPDAWVENVCHPRCHHVDAVYPSRKNRLSRESLCRSLSTTNSVSSMMTALHVDQEVAVTRQTDERKHALSNRIGSMINKRLRECPHHKLTKAFFCRDTVKIMAPFDSSLNHQRGENKGHNDGWFAMYVSNPEETCTMINNALYLARQEAVQTQMETQPPAVPVGSTKAKLQEFAEMRDMGLLSIQEFEDKKAELLREM